MASNIYPVMMNPRRLQPTNVTMRPPSTRFSLAPSVDDMDDDKMDMGADDGKKNALTNNFKTGFGNTNNSTSLFGNKPASNPFGASTNSGTGLFGNSTASGGGFGASTGGFGSNNNTSAFGSNNNNASSSFSFGGNANKPAFGNTTSATPLFGQGGSGTTSGFGATNAFGSGTALSNQPVPPSEGTASTPFAPHIEKDGTGPASSAYQSIVFQQPYQKYSFEELRLADYNAGRQFGNNTGQAGGFGSNSFGGFGSTNTNTGAFGSNNTPSGGLFGNNTTSASTGFGTNTSTTGFGGGGLFGNKPATGGLFGTQSSATTTGGLFGTSNNATNTGFGAAAGSSGGLFGNNQQNQAQNKPNPFGGTTSTPSFSFGNTNAAQTNTTPSGGLFGNSQQPNQSSGGLFGNNQQQSGGLFGNNNNQQKPLFGNSTGGFGASTTQNQGGGLFNNSTPQNNSGGLFGNNTNQQNNNTGGLFGATANTSGGLFGGNTANNSAPKPGGLFGGSFANNNNATNTGGGLFGNSTSNQQQSGGLFNNANSNNNSGFSFGNSTNKPASTGLFNNTSTNQSGGLFGGSAFGGLGASQNNQQNAQQQSDFRVSSLNDPNPYGQTSIWTGLPVPTPDNSKPIFTPLSASQKLKESQSKPPPSLRLNQSRYMTPPRRPGFGFSYSTYGTPNSAASTPGGGSLSNSMYGNRNFNGSSFGGSIGRSFGKSASASNLRSQFNVGDSESVLSPNAFNANSSQSRWSGGNMRRLTIDRSIRNDLFSRQSLPALAAPSPADKNVNETAPETAQNEPPATEPTKLRKRVSFDKDTTGGQNGTLNGETGALTRTENNGDSPEPESRGRAAVNGGLTPDTQQARGNELAVVPEDRASDHVSPKKTAVEAKPDPQPGDYWMQPTRAQLSKLPRDKLQEFVGFEVGRKGCGRVTFLGAVDLTALPMDDLYEKIVEIRLRSVTVYPDASSKPPVGKGLNVPSKISIENSWPRARGQPSSATSGPIFDKHVNRLKKMQGTEFVGYDVASGVWTFKVPHYTRYGLDYDDDDDLSRSQLSLPPDSLSGSQSGNVSAMEVDSESDNDEYDDDEDDTFAFKQKTVPGGYGKRSVIDDYEMGGPNAQQLEDGPESDLEEDENDDTDNEISMVGAFPAPAIMESPNKPILKASHLGTPGKALISLEGDWAEQLQRTISPRKQNREALRDVQSKVLLDRAFEPIKPRGSNKDQLNTSIDIMNSLFSKHEERMTKGRKAQAGPDFEV